MADKLPCKSLKISEKNKLINALQANEDVRSGESEKVVNSSHNMSSVSASAVNAAQSKKKTSFQITSVTVGSSRLSNDGGDDSADDLDESHTDDISRVTDNETPSISEDTFSKDEMCYNASVGSILTSAPVIPTSAQYGLAIVPESSGVGDVDGNRDVEMAGNDGDDGPTKSPPLSHKDNSPEPLPAQPVRHERFKVVKIESDVPFRRGRWICMDYLDHSIHMPTSSPWPNCCPWASPRPSVTPTAQPATPAPVPQTQTRPQTQSQFSQQSVSPSQTRQTSVNPQYQQTQTTQGNFTQASFQPSTATSQAYAQTYTSIPSTQSTQSSQPIMSQQSQPTNQQPYMVNQQQQQTQSQPASQQSAQSQSQVGYQGQQFLQNTGSVGRFTPQLSSTSVAPIQPSQSYPNTSTRQQNVISGQTYAGMPSQNEQQQQQPGQTSVYVVYQYQSPTKTTVTPTTYCAQTTTTGVFLQSSASAVSQPLVQQQFTSAGSKLPLAQYPNSTSAIKYTPTVAVSPTIDSKSIMTAVESQSQANVIVSVQTPNSVTTAAVTAAEDESASAASPVAIDNKIEQAMDLVKSHLMFAVREEVEVLKEKIAELMDRINQLELENTFLKAHVPAEILMQLTNNQIPEGQSAKPVFQSAVNNGNGAS